MGGCVWWYVNVYDVCVCFVTSFNFERLKCCLSGGRSAFVSCVIFESRVELRMGVMRPPPLAFGLSECIGA